MPNVISPARRAAHSVLLEMRHKPEAHSDALLRGPRLAGLSTLDKNLATTLVMGVLRWQLVLQQRIRAALTRSKSHLSDGVQVALEIGALQLLLLDRIPARAAIFESVELARQSGNVYAVGLVNAVLRKIALTPKIEPGESTAAHPQWLVDRWFANFGKSASETICQYDQQLPPTTIRLCGSELSSGLALEEGSFVAGARHVVSGELPDDAWIQDEGSQLIAELAGKANAILDCCAAPGGKTAILAERNPGASITACDVSRARLEAMKRKLGNKQIRYQVMDATAMPYKREFDLVLCDAPCSGTGTLARNPEIRHRLQPEDLARQQSRQILLLRAAMRAVRAGGRVIYSTCSLEPEEDELVVRRALEQESGCHMAGWRNQVHSLETEGVLFPGSAQRLFPEGTQDEFLYLLPGAYRGDGFFAACIVRD